MAELPAFTVHASPESVARWRIGRDGQVAPPPEAGSPLPLAYLVCLRIQPTLGVSIHALLGRDPDRGLYGGVGYRAVRTPCVGERFAATGAVTAMREVQGPRGTMVLRTLEVCYRAQTESPTVVTEAVRMIDLPPGPPAPPAEGPRREPAHPLAAAIDPVTRTQVAWLTVATGDLNPLHLDSAYAASRRYPDVVVPGTLTTALIEREAAKLLGRPLAALEVRLTAATFPGEALALHASARDGGLAFELYATGSLRAEGSAA